MAKEHLVGMTAPAPSQDLIGLAPDENGETQESRMESAYDKFMKSRAGLGALEADDDEGDLDDLELEGDGDDDEHEESGSGEGEDDSEEEEGVDADELDRARAALRRDKAPKALLTKLDKGDKETLEYALQRADAQDDVDRIADERSRLLNPKDPIHGATAQSASNDPAPAKPTGMEFDDATLDQALNGLKSAYGEDSAEVRGFLAMRQDRDALKGAYDGLAQRMDRMERSKDAEIAASQRQRLSEKRPSLRDKSKWDDVWDKAQRLAKTGIYGPGQVDELFDEAARIAKIPTKRTAPSDSDGGSENPKSRSPGKNGSVQRSTRRSDPKKAAESLSPEQRGFQEYKRILKNRSRRGA